MTPVATSARAGAPATGKRPNVVLIISDQHRADTMPGVRAAQMVRTPHLDWLAERGTSFRRAFCTDPVCGPARASLFTGLYPHATGMVANNQDRPVTREMHLAEGVRVLADYLKPLGYACAYTGKWHLGTWGDRRGFTDFATRAGDQDVDSPEQNDILRFCEGVGIPLEGKHVGLEYDPGEFDRHTRTGASLLPLAWHPSMLDAQAAAHWVRTRVGSEDPFCLVYSCHEPHPSFVSPRPFDRMYDDAGDQPGRGPVPGSRAVMPLPETRRDPAGLRLVDARQDRKLLGTPAYTDDELRRIWAAYYGAVSYVDHLVGTILAALVETDQLDDTLFIFTADHGEMLGSHSLLTKGAVLYDELVNIPFLVKPPGTAKVGHETRRLVSHVDLLPTILRWCGATVPDGLHGVDIRALVEGADEPVREGLALAYHSGNWGERPIPLRGWRTEDWKYVESQDGTDELYDLRADPLEMHNLIADSTATSSRDVMKDALRRWIQQSGDPWPDVPAPPQLLPEKKVPLGRTGS